MHSKHTVREVNIYTIWYMKYDIILKHWDEEMPSKYSFSSTVFPKDTFIEIMGKFT